MRVRKAVFPAAGWGTRFLPATKAQPKEMLPLVDKPVIQYAVEEAVAAGIEQVIIVTSSQKRAIEDHFDHSFELEHLLESKGDIEMLRRVRKIGDMAQISYVRQKEQLGLGHAVLMAKELVGHEPFAVILSDDVVTGERSCIGQLVEAYQRDRRLGASRSCRCRTRRPAATASSTPIPNGQSADERLRRIRGVVEKPEPETRPERPRHHRPLRPDAQDLREARADPGGAGGEIQLTDAIEALMEEQDVFAYAFEGTRHDAGTTMGWLKASVELALEREEFGAEFREYLAGVDLRMTGRSDVRMARSRGRMAELGAVLGGRYRLDRVLGQGGMATIYRATDAKLGREVAVKVLRPEYGADAAFVARFRREAQCRGVAEPPQHRRGLRLRDGRGRAVHRHGAGGRGRPLTRPR